MVILLLLLVDASLLKLNLKTSVGQIIEDSSGLHLDAVLGTSLLIEPTDAILTDRGAYFSSGTLISLPPNKLHPSSLLSISNQYIILLFFKALGAGCIFSVTNGSTTKQSLCWSSGVLTLLQNGSSTTQAAVEGKS